MNLLHYIKKKRFEKLILERKFIISDIIECEEAVRNGLAILCDLEKNSKSCEEMITDIKESVDFYKLSLSNLDDRLDIVEIKLSRLNFYTFV